MVPRGGGGAAGIRGLRIAGLGQHRFSFGFGFGDRGLGLGCCVKDAGCRAA